MDMTFGAVSCCHADVCNDFLLSPQGSLSGHAPKDQAYSQILEHVYSQLSITQ